MNNVTVPRVSAAGTFGRCARYFPVLALAMAGLLGACAKGGVVGGNTKQITGVAAPTDGFLPQPELLAHNEGTLWDLTYTKPGLDFHAYHAVMLDPVAIVTDPTSKLA